MTENERTQIFSMAEMLLSKLFEIHSLECPNEWHFEMVGNRIFANSHKPQRVVIDLEKRTVRMFKTVEETLFSPLTNDTIELPPPPSPMPEMAPELEVEEADFKTSAEKALPNVIEALTAHVEKARQMGAEDLYVDETGDIYYPTFFDSNRQGNIFPVGTIDTDELFDGIFDAFPHVEDISDNGSIVVHLK